MTRRCNVSERECGSGLLKVKSLRPSGAELLRLCRCEVPEASGTFHSKTHASPNLPTFKRIKHWSVMNMDELHFEIERWCLVFWPRFAVSAFSAVPPPEQVFARGMFPSVFLRLSSASPAPPPSRRFLPYQPGPAQGFILFQGAFVIFIYGFEFSHNPD